MSALTVTVTLRTGGGVTPAQRSEFIDRLVADLEDMNVNVVESIKIVRG